MTSRSRRVLKPRGETNSGSPSVVIASIAALVAAVAAFTGNVDKIAGFWCSNIGFICEYELVSQLVSTQSGGTSRNDSDECKEHVEPVCVTASTRYRSISSASVKFAIATQSGGGLMDGGPPGPNPVGTHRIGWYVKEMSPEKACVDVFARTSACETRVSISGKLLASEKWKWRPW